MFTNAFVTKSCEKNKMTLLEQGYLTRMNFNKQANKSNNKNNGSFKDFTLTNVR